MRDPKPYKIIIDYDPARDLSEQLEVANSQLRAEIHGTGVTGFSYQMKNHEVTDNKLVVDYDIEEE